VFSPGASDTFQNTLFAGVSWIFESFSDISGAISLTLIWDSCVFGKLSNSSILTFFGFVVGNFRVELNVQLISFSYDTLSVSELFDRLVVKFYT